MSPKVNGIWIPAGDKHKRLCDFHHLFGGKGHNRQEYIAIVQRMGIDDLCTCDPGPRYARKRAKSGNVGQLECGVCHELIAPPAYMYPCDECTEPILADHFPVMADEVLLCSECIWDL